jgi:carbonic anhydrase
VLRQREAEYAAVRLSLANLMTFPWIAERVRAGELRLHGAHYGIRSGVLALMDGNGAFREYRG